MPACGCGKYAVKLAEAIAGMHGRAVQVTTVPDDQQTHDLPVSDSGPAHPARTQSENVPLACGRAASWSPSPFAGLCSCSRQTRRSWGPSTAAGGSTCCVAVIVVAHGSGSRVGRGRPSPPGEDGHHHEGSDRQDDDPHAVRDGSPGRTTGADTREHEPKNQAHAQVASTSVFAGALTLPALEAGQSHSPAAW